MEKSDEFNEVLRSYGDMAYRMAIQLTGGREDEARDLVQDGFIKVWRFWAFQRPKSFKGWTYRLLRNLYIDGIRRQKRRAETPLEATDDATGLTLEDHLPDAGATPQARVETQERQAMVQKALECLDPTVRLCVSLCDMEGLAYEEIARIMNCPIGTVRSRIHRGRAELRAALVHLLSETPSPMRRMGEGRGEGPHPCPLPLTARERGSL